MKEYTCEQYYTAGLSFLFQEQISNAVNCFLEGAGMNDVKFSVLCKAMLSYITEIKSEGKGPTGMLYHEAIKYFNSGHPDKIEGNSFVTTIYFVGHTAEKIGMASENSSPLHPLYHCIYRALSVICYDFLLQNAPGIVDLYKKTNPLNIRCENITKTQQQKAQTLLDDNQIQELNLLLAGSLPVGGVIGKLFNHDLNIIKQINSSNIFERLLLVCSTISAKVNDLKC